MVGTEESPLQAWKAAAPAVRKPRGGGWRADSGADWDLSSNGALTLFFRWRKKSVQKKASGTATPEAARPAARYSQISAFRALPCPALVFAQACQSLTAYGSCAHWARAPSRPKLRPAVAPFGAVLGPTRFACAHPPGKRLLLPILPAGLAMSRAMKLDSFHQLRACALVLAFFRRQNGRAFFPPLPIAALSPPQAALGRLKWRCLGRFCVAWIFLLHKRPA